MEKTPAFTLENFIGNWNGEFPNHPLTAADLKKPLEVMKALLEIFDRLDIDREAILKPPPEESRTESLAYYWDLLPVINMTRVINHLVSVMPQVGATISIIHLLQPTVTTSHSILLLLFNLMVFNEERLRDIAPYEEELFAKTNQVKLLEDKKNQLLILLNQQAEEKGKRSEKLEKLDQDIKIYEDELKQEKEALAEDKLELEIAENENRRIQTILEQKKTHRDTLLAEVEKKKALRVYDAEDIKAQAEQAARNVQDAEEKLSNLKATLMQKENSLKNLQAIKPNLDTANNLLYDMSKLMESVREYEAGDLEADSKDGELEVLNTELSELEVQLQELKTAREEEGEKMRENNIKRQREKEILISNLHEAEERERKHQEQSVRASQRIEELKKAIQRYEQEKTEGLEHIDRIKDEFTNELKSIEDLLLKKAKESKKRIEEKLKNRNV
ncbi:mRNA export factor GLE1-like [Danaus plexippus]|uniref:mRNA export factor GLE1-like n=1 Tax=Danaus plexippus TaxID=13037 RepID=UPI0013C478B0|nr:mRNA export factor GLE1-like [Danaus plexippus]